MMNPIFRKTERNPKFYLLPEELQKKLQYHPIAWIKKDIKRLVLSPPNKQRALVEIFATGETIYVCALIASRIRMQQEAIANYTNPVHFEVRCNDFVEELKQIPDASVDMVLTDPPYGREYLPLYKLLAEQATRVLKDSASMIVYLSSHETQGQNNI